MIHTEQRQKQASGLIRVLLAGDHLLVREGLRLILAGQADFELVADAADGASMIRLVGEQQPDVVLMDLHMSGIGGLEAIEHIRRQWPRVAVVVLTTYDDDNLILRILHAGASSYLLKDTTRETLFHAIRTAARGETLLPKEVMAHLLARSMLMSSEQHEQTGAIEITQRERQVLAGVACGERNKEIALRLRISEPTVKSHLASIYYKLHVTSRASAVAVAIERGLISLPSQKTFKR